MSGDWETMALYLGSEGGIGRGVRAVVRNAERIVRKHGKLGVVLAKARTTIQSYFTGPRYFTASKHQARMPFCACRRFSASSNTTDCGPSITTSVTSSPRWAGRQCMNSASGLASDISFELT